MALDRHEVLFSRLQGRLPDLIAQADHPEMWGIELQMDSMPTRVVLVKFLRANNWDGEAAAEQLVKALKWRRRWRPAELALQEFDHNKFGGLGFVTLHRQVGLDEADEEGAGVGQADARNQVIIWHIYSNIRDKKATFGNFDEYLRFRIALMELGMNLLMLNQVVEPMAFTGEDPYGIIHVHDHDNANLFGFRRVFQSISREIRSILAVAYPEMLAQRYFVNVPGFVSGAYSTAKRLLPFPALRRNYSLSSGAELATKLPSIADSLPREYGGGGGHGFVAGYGLALAMMDPPPDRAGAANQAKEQDPTVSDLPGSSSRDAGAGSSSRDAGAGVGASSQVAGAGSSSHGAGSSSHGAGSNSQGAGASSHGPSAGSQNAGAGHDGVDDVHPGVDAGDSGIDAGEFGGDVNGLA